MGLRLALGIDIGGTNTQFGLVEQGGAVWKRGKIPTGEDLFDSFFQRLQAALDPIFEAYGPQIEGIGVGAPNAQPYRGEVLRTANMHWGEAIPVRDRFQQWFQKPVFLQNDANAAAWGEHLFGQGRAFKDFILLTLGTGLGSGIIQEGRLLLGQGGLAGELGHWIIEPEGRSCGCGRKGCLERYVSATGMVETARLWMETRSPSRWLSDRGPALTALDITKGAERGDALCLEIFDYTARILGRAMANMVACLAPEAIILFGGLAEAGSWLFSPLESYFNQDLLYLYEGKVQILPSQLPSGEAAILGAASLVWHSPLQPKEGDRG